jgi:hypothetical protein
MTKKQRWLVALLVAAILAWAGNRFFWSCTWAARDISKLSLEGSVRVVACRNDFWGKQEIDLVLDAAATAAAAREAAGLPGWRRMEDVPSNTNSSTLAALLGHHGVFRTNLDNSSPKGPQSFVGLDIDDRTLTVRRYEQ